MRGYMGGISDYSNSGELANIFGDAGSLTSKGHRKLHIASDVSYTITNTSNQPRRDYLKALMLAKLAGHDVTIATSRPDDMLSKFIKNVILPKLIKELER